MRYTVPWTASRTYGDDVEPGASRGRSASIRRKRTARWCVRATLDDARDRLDSTRCVLAYPRASSRASASASRARDRRSDDDSLLAGVFADRARIV